MKNLTVWVGILALCLMTGARADDLMSAAGRGDLVAVNTLIAHGADVNAKDGNGQTALYWATTGGHTDVMQTLLAHGADVNAKNISGQTALEVAAQLGHNDVVKTLLARGADVNAQDEFGYTALEVAAQFGHNDVVKTLLAHGADVHAKDKSGYTALKQASGHPNTVALLENAMNRSKANALAKGSMAKAHNPRAALATLLVQLKTHPNDEALRQAIIQVAAKIRPAPRITNDARRHMGHGLAAFGLAKTPQDYQSAIKEFQQASNRAPWWPDPYYNLAKAEEQAGDDQGAATSFQNYLAAAPHAADASQVRTELYKVQYLAQQKAKLGQRQQNAQTILAYLRSHYGGEITYDAMCFSSISPMTYCTAEQANGPGLYWHAAALPPGYPYGTIQYALVGSDHDEIQATMPDLDLCGTVGLSGLLNDVAWSGVGCGQPLGEDQTDQTTTFETSTQGAPMIDYVGCKNNDTQGACDRIRIVLSNNP